MASPSRPVLLRAIGRWDLTAAVVNGVIGSGIFGMPAVLALHTGAKSPLACLLGGLGVLTIVLCFAEVASRFSEGGGPYRYAGEAFGSFVGFEVGWVTFWVRVTSLAANLNIFVSYLSNLAPSAGTGAPRAVVMVVLVAFVTAINLRGVRQATWTVNLFTLAKLAPLALLALLGLPHVRADVLATQTPAAVDWTQAILLLMFAYGGFEAPLIPAGEARDPRKDSAFALLVALGVIATVYTLVQLTIVGVVPHVAGMKAPVAAAFGVLLGPLGVALASVGAMISVYGFTAGNVLQSPRVLFAMADRGDLPEALARIHPRYRTPHVAILVFALVTLSLSLPFGFAALATVSAILRLLTYGLTCAALPVLRRRSGAAPFSLPGGAGVWPVALAFCAWLLWTRSFAEVWVLAGLVVVGALLWVWARFDRGRGERRPLSA